MVERQLFCVIRATLKGGFCGGLALIVDVVIDHCAPPTCGNQTAGAVEIFRWAQPKTQVSSPPCCPSSTCPMLSDVEVPRKGGGVCS